MRPGALPISQIVLIDIIAPPVTAGLWWLMARGWAIAVQQGNPSEETRGRQKMGFWAIMIMSYFLMIGATIYYAWLT
jgi:hypothetical protein